ncbi:DUF3293 domain-containing protein [Streptomyces sp. NPDC056309]|uniref:DUF3293 domain-containing protein n=1 Tax=unclassified Streptomyces TaxID=2593676 RepID=UPI0035DEE877
MHAIDAAGSPRNWDLYRTAVADIRFEDRTVRVEPRPRGTAEGLFLEPAGSATVHVITAWNPRGRTASAEDNARAQGLLLDEIRRRGLTWWPAEGGDACGTHREESIAVVGLSDTTARELGHRFGQDAIFAWTPDAWRVLACDSEAAAVSGWAASENCRPSALRANGDAGNDRLDDPSGRRFDMR